MNPDNVVTRFPPSPTGDLHLGGARTALFNWLLARRHGGKFVLRIEDTDRERSSDEATQGILEAMEWLGLDWDEGPYFQTRRLDIYRAEIDRLLSEGKAYWCHCSPETLKAKREAALAAKKKPNYDRTCRDKGLGPAEGAVVRLKIPIDGATTYNDLIMGPIRIENQEMDDLVILRSDGWPTYHLACVVDDVTMGVTHVIRGQDHVNNTPRQILIYQALGAELPRFGHVPMIHGQDGAKLSKRHGATNVMAYKEMGVLPEALLNYLVRLGWSHGDEEIFSREEMIAKFDVANIGRSAGVFNMEKLLWLNQHYLMAADNDRLAGLSLPFFEAQGISPDRAKVESILDLFKPRAKTLVELAEQAAFIFVAPTEYEPKGVRKQFTPQAAEMLERLAERLQDNPFTEPALDESIRAFAGELGVGLGKVAQPLRLALTGRTASPGIFEIMAALGKDETLARIAAARRYIDSLGEKELDKPGGQS